ncbi:dienelactone hydrolase family protein [Aestuariimicrobium ganziense]|uniref:dienelactone hydrolase family protein n=1 Tax=Aestuariimicrobium ganziense TaxID=2773677 RepID=UPI001944B2F7|nr:dienelactone hydrolase family protein [Aestuariimicrobium ganziense]
MPEITLPNGMPATTFWPEAGHDPGIVLVQEIFGRTAYMRKRAQDLADYGYCVVLPQIYWRLGEDAIEESSEGALEKAMGLMSQVDWEQAVDDVRATVGALRLEPDTDERVALVGFCFGGGLAYAAAQGAQRLQGADALISYYGSALPNLVDGDPVEVPSLHHFGESDSFIPMETVEHIREVVTRNEDAEFHTWPGADHAFDNPAPQFHHAEASEQAWQVTLDWLAEHYPA